MTTLRAFVGIVRNDLLRWLRSPSALTAAILPPMGLALVLYLLSLSVGRQPVALVVQTHNAQARVLAGGFASDTDAYIVHRVDMRQARAELADQLVAAIIRIPPGFSLRDGEQVDLTLNNIDTDFSDDIRRSVTRTVGLFDLNGGHLTDLDADDNVDGHPTVYPVYLTFHQLRKTNVPFARYELVSVLILIVINVGVLGAALLGAQDVESGTARMLLLAPVGSFTIAFGKVVAAILAAWLLLIPVVILGAATGYLTPEAGHWPWLLAVLASTTLFSCGLGLLLGALLRGTRLTALLTLNVATVLFFLGGGFTTIAFLPPWLEHLSRVVPTRYAIQALRQTLFYPSLEGVTKALEILVVSGVCLSLVGSVALVAVIRNAGGSRFARA